MPTREDRTRAVTSTDLGHRLGTDPSLRLPTPRPTSRKAALTVIHGAALGRTYPIGGEGLTLDVGRAPESSIQLVESTVSREHARIETGRNHRGGLEVRIRDLGGRNGTYVNGHPVRDAVLESGDKVQLGEVILRFDLLDDLDLSYQEVVAEKVSQVDVDPQTRLRSKHYFLSELPARIEEWLDLRIGYALALIDIDFFKDVNDRLGHDVGDRVLAAVGEAILREVRRADIAIRFGGDELLLVLPGADLSEARIVASRVRATIRNDVSVVAGEGELISATIGVAAHGSGDTFERVFERADTALRRAKALGRDRVLCDGDE
ncbi:MAG: GGDEF domain-containing protein [Deltaproteobacteria bacterium]|nr:GGDEF domain-containing protein [Deltaproteobacteria bacterium]